MILTDTAIDTAKPTSKPFKLRDSEGLYLLVMPNGSKYFRLDYRLGGKRQTLALGVYPETSLEAARASRDIAKKDIKDGIKPKLSTARKPVSTKTDTVKDLERQLQAERRRNDELQGKLAALMVFSHLTKEQQAMLSVPDNPALTKLKELAKLSVDRGIGDFEDAELVKELERRGFEVSIYKEISK